MKNAVQAFALYALAGFGCIAIGYWLREFVGFRHGFTSGYQKALDDVYSMVDPQLEDVQTAAIKTEYTHGQISAFRAVHMTLRDLEDGR